MVLQPVEYYNANAREYARKTMALDMTPIYDKFLPLVPKGGRILDAGCGAGRDSLFFLEQGFEVSAFDASPGMVEEANAVLPIEVQLMTFEGLEYGPKSFDAIWSCASLLHLMPEDLPLAISQLSKLLKDKGLLYCSFKKGEGLRVDDLGRRFTDMTEGGLIALLEDCGLNIVELFKSIDVGGECWLNGLAQV